MTIEFDVCFDTEDDPEFNIQAFDGFLLRMAGALQAVTDPRSRRFICIPYSLEASS